MATPVLMPQLGNEIEEAQIDGWLKQVAKAKATDKDELIRQAYLRTLNRLPDEREMGVSRKALEGGLGAEHARRPVRLRVHAAQQTKKWPSDTERERAPHPLLHQVHHVSTVSSETFVAPVA